MAQQTAAQAAQSAQAKAIQQNLTARHMLLSSAMGMRTKIQTVSGQSPGDKIRVKLDNTGILMSLDIIVTGTVTQGATAANYWPFAPYNLIERVSLLDYNRTERVNTDGWSLYFLNSVRAGRVLDLDSANESAYTTSTGFRFNLNIPAAYDPANDLRGAILSQTVVGEQFLNIQLSSNYLGNDPFANVFDNTGGASATISNIQIEVYQNYIQPQNLNSLPLLDLGTVYEIAGTFNSSSDIASGQAKYLNYPNVRTVLSALAVGIDNGAVMSAASFNELEIWANSNANLRQYSYLSMRQMLLNHIVGYDVPDGVLFFNSRSVPIATSLYGNVQAKINFNTVTGTAPSYLQAQFESFYPNGSPLPGIQTGG